MDPSHLLHNIVEFLTQLSGVPAYCTIVGVLLACGLGLPIPEDITLLTAGLLAAHDQVSFLGALISGFVGVLLGDAILFFLGRRFGKKFFRLPGLRRVFTEARIAAAEARIRKNGPFICFIARFLPGLRSPIFAMSGALGVRRSTFFMLDGFAALLSVPLWVYVGYWFGSHFDNAIEDALAASRQLQIGILTVIVTLILGYAVFVLARRRRLQAAARLATESIAPAIANLNQRE